MDSQPNQDYQIMDENAAPAAPPAEATPPAVPQPPPIPTPAVPEPPTTKEVEIPVSPSVPAPVVAPVAAPVAAPAAPAISAPTTTPMMIPQPFLDVDVDSSMDVLVAMFATTRFLTGVSLINAAGQMYNESPGAHYMIAGIFLFASIVTEFLAKNTNMFSFVTGVLGSLLIGVGGTMALQRADIDIAIIGIMWIVASLLLVVSHSYDVIFCYGKVNYILLSSKCFAMVGAFLFCIGGIIMYSLEDAGLDQVYKFQTWFTVGGVAYLIHAINMATGHKVVLDRVFEHAQQNYHINAGLSPANNQSIV